MNYRLAIVSRIPVVKLPGGYCTLDLWARDANAQVGVVQSLTLICPIVKQIPEEWSGSVALHPSIEVVGLCEAPALGAHVLRGCDVLQLPANGWADSGPARALMRVARRLDKPVILGISSNRARTARMNASGKGFLRKLRGELRSLSIRASQAYLASRADGVFIVGEGLRPLVQRWSPNIFVGTASWIQEADLAAPRTDELKGTSLRLGVATRLEPMKGVHVAIDGFELLASSSTGLAPSLAVIGAGPEKDRLVDRVRTKRLEGLVSFTHPVPYPGPFFQWLRQIDIVLLTNLNDEQPRLVFDAISQGCLPVCPDTEPYRRLGLPAILLAPQGDAAGLTRTIKDILSCDDLSGLRAVLLDIARGSTIESMHAKRARWIRTTVLGGRGDAGQSVSS